MANEQQNNGNQQKPQEPPKLEMVEVRMRPGCGKMLIGRLYRLIDGTETFKRPKLMDDVLDTEEKYIPEREVSKDGTVGDGPIVKVPLALVQPFLDKSGKPSRVVEGYPMTKVPGNVSGGEDEHGNPIPPVADTWKAGYVTRKQDGTLIASQPDATFEIVRRTG